MTTRPPGHPENAIDPGSGPAARFGFALRELRKNAGSPPYRKMARAPGVHYSASNLSTAANGRQIPDWHRVEAYVTACEGPECTAALRFWYGKWCETHLADDPAWCEPPELARQWRGELATTAVLKGTKISTNDMIPLGDGVVHRRSWRRLIAVTAIGSAAAMLWITGNNVLDMQFPADRPQQLTIASVCTAAKSVLPPIQISSPSVVPPAPVQLGGRQYSQGITVNADLAESWGARDIPHQLVTCGISYVVPAAPVGLVGSAAEFRAQVGLPDAAVGLADIQVRVAQSRSSATASTRVGRGDPNQPGGTKTVSTAQVDLALPSEPGQHNEVVTFTVEGAAHTNSLTVPFVIADPKVTIAAVDW